jgi:hypothetical protein
VSDLVRHLQDVARYGATATIAVITGTACPCMTSRDSARPAYSAEWHRLNTGAAACSGTGIISATTTTTTVTALFCPVSASSNSIPMIMEKLAALGEIDEKDMMMFSPVKSDGSAFSLAGMVERKDKVTYDGKQYLVRAILDLAAGINIGQWALLKRIV